MFVTAIILSMVDYFCEFFKLFGCIMSVVQDAVALLGIYEPMSFV